MGPDDNFHGEILAGGDAFVAPIGSTSSFAAASAPGDNGATWQDNSEFMLGTVAVNVVLLESNGSIDPSTENWTPSQITQVKNEINEGLTWWENTLAARGSVHSLDFIVDFNYSDSPVANPYEPINRPYYDDSLWTDAFLTSVGYNTPGNRFDDLRRYNHDRRIALDTDWATTVFVVNSDKDSDGRFSDGRYFAYAYVGGPYLVMTYDNNGYGISSMGQVLAHEMGHIFYALDEYAGGASYYDRSGYYSTQNLNASNYNPNPSARVPSIMGDWQIAAYSNHTSSPTSLQMIGWRDSDADGVFDVLDVPLSLTGTGYYNPAPSPRVFSGHSLEP